MEQAGRVLGSHCYRTQCVVPIKGTNTLQVVLFYCFEVVRAQYLKGAGLSIQ